MQKDVFIQCRVTAATKAALHTAAVHQHVTVSALLKRLVELFLQTTTPVATAPRIDAPTMRLVRVYVRLTPDDFRLLTERATARCLAPATYLSTLARAHLRALTPLLKDERLLLRRTMNELAAIGRNLNQIARVANESGKVPGPSREELRGLLKVCEACAITSEPSSTRTPPAGRPAVPRSPLRVPGERPLLELISHARKGPGRDRLTPAQLDLISRTVRRVPEVMVKVSGGGKTANGVIAHLKYIDRYGEFEIETDDGESVSGKGIEKKLVADWDVEAEASEVRSPYGGTAGRRPVKLVHNVVLSMPAGTSSKGLLKASQAFARELFGSKHRYAMVLHTDQKHPHVHLVVKAMSEQGQRLNIYKATLREWRQTFARHLRAQGIAANATERVVRGQTKPQKRDCIHRAMMRGKSTHLRERLGQVVTELREGQLKPEPQAATLREARTAIQEGWRTLSVKLVGEGQPALADRVNHFVDRMPPPRTEREWLAEQLRQHARRERLLAIARPR